MAVTQKFVGQPVLRKEDPEFLTGTAKYTDDLTVPGMLWMAVVRSPYAHARIKGVDLTKALGMPGVVAAYWAQDFEWAGPLLMAWPATEDLNNPPHYPLAKDEAPSHGDQAARAGGAPLVHDDLGTNRSYTWANTNGDVDKVFAEAAVVVKERYRVQRQ